VLREVELVVVHADDDGDVLALGGSGDDDLLGAGLKVAPEGFPWSFAMV